MWWKRVWRFLRRWGWAILAVVAAILGGIIVALARKPNPAVNNTTTGHIPPVTFKQKAQQEVERVRLEGEIEKARVQATTESRHATLDTIEQVGENDPAEGRRMLATWMASNL